MLRYAQLQVISFLVSKHFHFQLRRRMEWTISIAYITTKISEEEAGCVQKWRIERKLGKKIKYTFCFFKITQNFCIFCCILKKGKNRKEDRDKSKLKARQHIWYWWKENSRTKDTETIYDNLGKFCLIFYKFRWKVSSSYANWI